MPAALAAQQVAPTAEDGEIPAPGEVRLRAGPFLQAWHQEFGPGPSGSAAVPLAEDWSGPVLDRIYPGPEAILAPVNADAGALGFEPVDASGASLGSLDMREVSSEIRSLGLRMEVGILDWLAADASVPVVWTEVEAFGGFDPAGATLGSAAAVFESPASFFDQLAAARSELQGRLDSGELSGEDADRARRLLDQSGAFAEALLGRVEREALVPLAGTPAGAQLLGHYQGLQDGFDAYGLALPGLTLPAEAGTELLGALPGDPLETAQRGWLFGEAEFGLRVQVHDGLTADSGRSGLATRTAAGVRVRLPFRPGNATPFVQPSDLTGLPVGDGQRDLEFSLYQDLRWGSWLKLGAVARYGLQRADELTVRRRSPERPLAFAASNARVERDLGDYLRLRLAPRLVLNRFLSLGAEYRYWSKGRDRYRILGEDGDVSGLEAETEETRHRLGLGAFYRPDPPEEKEEGSVEGAPELGVVWQTAVSGSGGEVPAANLVNFHVRIPVRVF